MDQERKRQLRNQYKQQEILQARKSLGLFPDQLRELHAHIENTIYGLGIACDHTLSRTREWAETAGLDPEAVVRGVNAHGGFCDCEVVLNVTFDKFGWSEQASE